MNTNVLTQKECVGGGNRESHVTEALSRVYYHLETLEANAAQIITRLEQVLRSENVGSRDDSQTPADNILATPLASSIVGIADRISRVNAVFMEILNRLEL